MTTLDRNVLIVPRPAVLPEDVLKQRLRTVEDIHDFFCSFDMPKDGSPPPPNAGRIPPFKFVYCAKVDSGLEFRPYDIVAVKRGEQPSSHYVVSPNAVVHVAPTKVSEVVLIREWIKESRQFDALRRIAFFKKYLLAKWIRRWKENVSYTRYLQSRVKLGKKFFPGRQTFSKATVELRKLAFDTRLNQSTALGGKVPPTNGKQNNQEVSMIPGQLMKQGLFPIRLIFYPDSRPQWGYTADAFR